MSAREIAGISFGASRRGLLVCLRVYFDGAGKEEDHPTITVGGFMAEAAMCEAIEADWKNATGGKLFHLKDFGYKKCKLGSKDWTSTDRASFLKKLAGIVNRPGVSIISASLEVEPFNTTLQELKHPHEIGPAFSACAFAALSYAEEPLTRENRRMEKVRYIFEKGDREHEIIKVFEDWSKSSEMHGHRGHGFEPKELTLLQPADLIAGIVQKCVVRAHKAFPCLDNGNSRTPLNNLERHYSYDGVTAAVVAGHDREHCWIVNPKTLKKIDGISTRLYAEHPDRLEKRLKKYNFQPRTRKIKS